MCVLVSPVLFACARVSSQSPVRSGGAATACVTPRISPLVRDLEPATLHYQGTFVTAERSMPVTSTVTVALHPEGGWVIVERAVLPRGEARDSARLAPASLAPRERVIQQGSTTIVLRFSDSLATGTVTAAGESRAIASSLCGTLFGDGAGAFIVIGRLPLALGYRVTLQHFDVRSGAASRKELETVGSESVNVPAGSFDTWKVELREGGNPAPTVVWIDKRSLIPVRFVSSQGPVTVTQELAH